MLNLYRDNEPVCRRIRKVILVSRGQVAPWPLRGRVSYQRCCIVVPSPLRRCFVRTDTAASRRCPCYGKYFHLVRAWPLSLRGAVQVIVIVVIFSAWPSPLRGAFHAIEMFVVLFAHGHRRSAALSVLS